MANISKMQARVAADVVEVLQGAASQSGNLLEFRNSSNVLLAAVDANGNFVTPNGGPASDFMGGMHGGGAPKTGPRAAGASVAGDAAASGSSETPARIDHMHDRQADAALYWMAVKP
jgi:hypothetical protein